MSADSSLKYAVRATNLWLNQRLKRHGLYCYDFVTDLSDGILLHKLLQAEEMSSPQLTSSGAPLSSFGHLRHNRDGSTHNLEMIVNYLESKGVFCGELHNVLPVIATSDDSSQIGSDNEEENSDVSISNSDNSIDQDLLDKEAVAPAVMLFVWKVFEHLRGKQAMSGLCDVLPKTPTHFAKEMLTWAQNQTELNHEKNSVFPLRKPTDLTERCVLF